MNIKWRGTWGIGDAMMALNVAHNYSFTYDTPVKLEMHWPHDEDFILDLDRINKVINLKIPEGLLKIYK